MFTIHPFGSHVQPFASLLVSCSASGRPQTSTTSPSPSCRWPWFLECPFLPTQLTSAGTPGSHFPLGACESQFPRNLRWTQFVISQVVASDPFELSDCILFLALRTKSTASCFRTLLLLLGSLATRSVSAASSSPLPLSAPTRNLSQAFVLFNNSTTTDEQVRRQHMEVLTVHLPARHTHAPNPIFLEMRRHLQDRCQSSAWVKGTSPGACKPHVWKTTRGLPPGPTGPLDPGQQDTPSVPWLKGSFPAGNSPSDWVKGNVKKRLSVLPTPVASAEHFHTMPVSRTLHENRVKTVTPKSSARSPCPAACCLWL